MAIENPSIVLTLDPQIRADLNKITDEGTYLKNVIFLYFLSSVEIIPAKKNRNVAGLRTFSGRRPQNTHFVASLITI